MEHINHSILYIEDDNDISDVVCFLLQQANFKVTSASTLKEVLTSLDDGIFSLYLLGGFQKDVSNIEICREIRQRDPYSPILIYSTLDYETDLEESIKVGAGTYFYLLNPDDLFEITNTISSLLNKKDRNLVVN
jgi:DNA-binding response OmpR family regulator